MWNLRIQKTFHFFKFFCSKIDIAKLFDIDTISIKQSNRLNQTLDSQKKNHNLRICRPPQTVGLYYNYHTLQAFIKMMWEMKMWLAVFCANCKYFVQLCRIVLQWRPIFRSVAHIPSHSFQPVMKLQEWIAELFTHQFSV